MVNDANPENDPPPPTCLPAPLPRKTGLVPRVGNREELRVRVHADRGGHGLHRPGPPRKQGGARPRRALNENMIFKKKKMGIENDDENENDKKAKVNADLDLSPLRPPRQLPDPPPPSPKKNETVFHRVIFFIVVGGGGRLRRLGTPLYGGWMIISNVLKPRAFG